MKKILLVAVAGAALFSTSVQAEQVGLVRGLVGTGVAVLQAPGMTLSNLVQGRAVYAGNLAPFGLNFANVTTAFLTGKPIPASAETIAIPLPGPEFLNVNLFNMPGMARMNVKASGPILVTYETGSAVQGARLVKAFERFDR